MGYGNVTQELLCCPDRENIAKGWWQLSVLWARNAAPLGRIPLKLKTNRTGDIGSLSAVKEILKNFEGKSSRVTGELNGCCWCNLSGVPKKTQA